MDLTFSRALKKNHDAMEQIGKPFVQRFKKHGVRSEIYHLSSNSSRAVVAEAAQQASRKRLLLLRA
jgi:uroporphyrinogen-III synthase